MSSAKRPNASSSSCPLPQDIEIGGPSETDSLLDKGRTRVARFFHGFVDFAFQGNILQIAFGLMCVLSSLHRQTNKQTNKHSQKHTHTQSIEHKSAQ